MGHEMDRYEFKDGSSQKYWEVAVEGETLTVRYGRIGTDGQVKAKAFGDAAAAEKEKAKLVREKTGKGYVAAGQSATPAPVAAAVAKPTAPKATAPAKAKAVAENKSVVAPPASAPAAPPLSPDVSASAPSAAIGTSTADASAQGPVETGRLLDVAPLPSRTRPPKSMTAAEAWAELVQNASVVLARGKRQSQLLIDAAHNPPPRTMPIETAIKWLAALEWNVPDASVLGLYRPFLRWLLPSFGPGIAMDACAQTANNGNWLKLGVALREALTAASPQDYEAAIRWYPGGHGPSLALEGFAAFVLADDRPEPHPLQATAVLEKAFPHTHWEIPNVLGDLLMDAQPSRVATAWRELLAYGENPISFTEPGQGLATIRETCRTCGESPLPTFKRLLGHSYDEQRTLVASAILDTHENEALPLLLPLLHDKHIRVAFERAFEVYPAWLFQRCLAALSSGRSEPILRARVLKMIETHGADTTRAWAAGGGGRIAGYFESLIGESDPVAQTEHVPPFLLDPPWRKKRQPAVNIVLAIAPKDVPFAYTGKASPHTDYARDGFATLDKLHERMEQYRKHYPDRFPAEPIPRAEHYAELCEAEAAATDWLMRNRPKLNALCGANGFWAIDQGMHGHFDSLALKVWDEEANTVEIGIHNEYYWREAIPTMLSRFGARVLPGTLRIIQVAPVKLFSVIEHMDAAALAPLVARTLVTSKRLGEEARDWLCRHPRTALMALIPIAVGPSGTARDEAEFAVRWLKATKPDAVTAAIAEYAASDPQFPAAITQVLNPDPFARVPAKIAKLPAWLSLATLPRPKLKAGGALPDAAMTALVEMLSFINPDDVYAGIPAMREACTPASLAEFAWGLFSSWLAEGAPSKEAWALRAVGWLGDDECARQLTRLVRKWPGEAAHARAVIGLDVLADIGTDVALMNLNGIAEKLKFKGLQERARAKIAVIAAARDLSPEELADRLVPDLDLDGRGGLDLDFGPRQFRVGFDEFLKPWVKDAGGVRLKDLPKSAKSDDGEKAAAAVQQWSTLKKDARTIASLQLTRLEDMLVSGRRARAEVFWTFFAAHPLIRHLAQRLVWGVYDTDTPNARPTRYFRVTEDLTFSDAGDNAVAIDVSAEAAGLIGVAHPLHMSAADQAQWGTLFGDYEIAQPFAQLGRDTYALTVDEKASNVLKRFEGSVVEAKRLRGMASRHWNLGPPQDGGGISWLEWPVTLADGSKMVVMMHFHEGLIVGMASEEEQRQTLEGIELQEAGNFYGATKRLFGELDAVTASEILRGVTGLVESSAR